MRLKSHPTHPTWDLQMIWLECKNAIEITPQTSALLGWNLKGIRETFGVPIYGHPLAVCVSTPIESMIPEQELSPSVKQVNMQLKLHPTHTTWNLRHIWLECENAIDIAPQISVLLGWNLKGIRETFGVLIYDCHSAAYVSTPIESMIRLETFWFQLGTHCEGAALHLLRGEYYTRRVTILMRGIQDCLSTKGFSREKKVRFITWHRTMNNQISHLFMLTGMLIVS